MLVVPPISFDYISSIATSAYLLPPDRSNPSNIKLEFKPWSQYAADGGNPLGHYLFVPLAVEQFGSTYPILPLASMVSKLIAHSACSRFLASQDRRLDLSSHYVEPFGICRHSTAFKSTVHGIVTLMEIDVNICRY